MRVPCSPKVLAQRVLLIARIIDQQAEEGSAPVDNRGQDNQQDAGCATRLRCHSLYGRGIAPHGIIVQESASYPQRTQ